jgi:ADP-heptose:LPS heptosyltransferase
LPVRFVRGHKPLRVQNRNILRQPASRWTEMPGNAEVATLSYGPVELQFSDVYSAIMSKMPPDLWPLKPEWDLPDLGQSPLDAGGAPLAIIRPPTRRAEWDNTARNPLPAYIEHIAQDLKDRGFAVVVLADLATGEEDLVGPLPPHNAAFLHGEMNVRQLLATVRDAAVVVGGVGWIVPAAVALGTPTFVVLGGNGGMNAPHRLLHPVMPAGRIGFAMPPNFCGCTDMRHACDKVIPNLDAQWQRWRKRAVRGPRCSIAS